MRLSVPTLFSALALATFSANPSFSAEFQIGDKNFRLPDGFEIEQVAGPPLVDRPIVADFDERGRLYVADSSGSNDNVQTQLEEKPHRIVRLEDTDGDGRFDRRSIFADRMMFPEGAMWRDGSLYVAAPPSIWKLTDTDDDGVADRREEWFQGKTLTGCANDLHGPYNGPDGRIYWCKGAFAEQTYERPGQPPFVTRASHIFRARPDGSEIEPVMTGGMDNPVEVVFTPGGERILTATFLQHPAGGRRDGLIHAIYGGVYGKVHDVIEGHPRTGPEVMPALTHLGPAAPSGLARYGSTSFGESYRDNLLAALFNLHKVTRHVLQPDGATFQTRDEDFLTVAEAHDFHPTDVLEDADGSLLVLDTGGWYKLCCPTSQIGKPDVLGAIYRVRRTNATRVNDPRGLTLDWKGATTGELSARLGDARPAVRHRAVSELAERGESAVEPLVKILANASNALSRRNAVWALSRIEGDAARAAARDALNDDDEINRQAALHCVGLRRDARAKAALTGLLRNASPQNCRAAAEALGRIGDPSSVAPLLEAAGMNKDRVCEHSITFALIEIADPEQTARGLESPNPATRRVALTALDQMPGGRLSAGDVVPEFSADDPAMRAAAVWIASHHPQWGDAIADHYRTALNGPKAPESTIEQLATFAAMPEVQSLLAARLANSEAAAESRVIVLSAMAQSNVKAVPESWAVALAAALKSSETGTVSQVVKTLRALPAISRNTGDLAANLRAIATSSTLPVAMRLDALNTIPDGPGEIDDRLFTFLIEQLDPDGPITPRLAAADALAKARLTLPQLGKVAEALKDAGPLEAGRLLVLFDAATDEGVGTTLVRSLMESPGVGSWRVDALKPHLARFGASVQAQAEALYRRIEQESADRKATLDALQSALPPGDARRGQAVFNGSKAACVTCHTIGYLGGEVGPDLSRVGAIREERDLLEAVVYPSASFVRSYEPIQVATKAGQVYSGVLRRDAPDEVVLATGAAQAVRVARDEIEEMRPGTVSVMPAGLDKQLSQQELADLIAFLRSRK